MQSDERVKHHTRDRVLSRVVVDFTDVHEPTHEMRVAERAIRHDLDRELWRRRDRATIERCLRASPLTRWAPPPSVRIGDATRRTLKRNRAPLVERVCVVCTRRFVRRWIGRSPIDCAWCCGPSCDEFCPHCTVVPS